MPTQRLDIFGHSAVPDASGEVYLQPYTVDATNDNWAHLTWVLEDGSTRTGIYGTFEVPQSYVDTANLVVVWTATATSGDVEIDFDYRAVGGNDIESLDQATAQEAVNSNDTAPSATDERMEISISLTDGNFAAGDTVEYFLARDKSDAGDTMAANMIVFGAYFEFADA